LSAKGTLLVEVGGTGNGEDAKGDEVKVCYSYMYGDSIKKPTKHCVQKRRRK
jgi:hypothetical protein